MRTIIFAFYFFAGSFIREVPAINDHELDCKKTVIPGVCDYFVYVEDNYCLEWLCIYDHKEFTNEN